MRFCYFKPKYSKTCLKWPFKMKTKNLFQDRLSLHEGRRYCRMLHGSILQYFGSSLLQNAPSAILSIFIKLPFVIKIFVLSIFEWPFKTGFTASKSVLGSFDAFLSSADFFSEIKQFQKILWEYHQSVKQFGSRSGSTFCWA